MNEDWKGGTVLVNWNKINILKCSNFIETYEVLNSVYECRCFAQKQRSNRTNLFPISDRPLSGKENILLKEKSVKIKHQELVRRRAAN